jgi:hypothetical protein
VTGSRDPELQAAIVDLLGRPETYGIQGPVQIEETHISLVFLAGESAYKLKKPVRFPFLDYSTPERRRAACEAELEVNRAISPSLYRSVEPVVRSPEGELRLGGTGEPVDWVVVMRRFPAQARLDRVAEREGLDAGLASALADRIALMHDQAEPQPGFGGAAAMRRVLDMTAGEIDRAAGPPFDRETASAWARQARRALDRIAPLLDRRRSEARVRGCHGDLHLQNLCLVDGVPTPFDAIEFDPAIANIDVLYDLAFLLMDLGHRGLDGAANRVMNRYLDRRDETDGLAALPFFQSLRAAIRAEVRAAAASQHGDEAIAREASGFLDLALALLAPHAPCLVAVGGLSGTGKSTLAYALAPRLGGSPGARVARSDVLRKRLAGVAPEERLPESWYSEAATAATYRRLHDEAGACLDAGMAAVVDAVHGSARERHAVEAIAESRGRAFVGLWLEAPLPDLEERLGGRAGDASDATIDVLRRQAAVVSGAEGWRSIDASGGPSEVLARAGSALRAAGVPLR